MSNDKHHEDCSLHNAPSQPAGAIEFGLDAAVGEIIRQVYGPYASTMNADERKTARDTLSEIVSRYARQQTAAKDAEILKLQEQVFRPLGDNHHNAALCPYCNPQREAAERERDSLREALRAHGQHNADCLWLSGHDCNCGLHAALKAGKDEQK